MKTTLAILNKQCKDSLSNLQSLMILIIYPAVAFIMTAALGNEEGMNRMFICMFGTMHCTFIPIVLSSTILAEEKEKGTLRSLILSGVGRINYLVSISLFVIIVTMLTGSTFLLMDSFTDKEILKFLATMLCGAIISMLIGLCVGINAKNVTAANGMAMPIGLLLALLPMLAQFNDSIAKVARFTYSRQISLVVEGGRDISAEMLIICGVYAAVLSILLVLLFEKKGIE